MASSTYWIGDKGMNEKSRRLPAGQARAHRKVCAPNVLHVLALLLIAVPPHVHAEKQVTYYYTDLQGTPLAETDAAGNILVSIDYRPYGAQALGATRMVRAIRAT